MHVILYRFKIIFNYIAVASALIHAFLGFNFQVLLTIFFPSHWMLSHKTIVKTIASCEKKRTTRVPVVFSSFSHNVFEVNFQILGLFGSDFEKSFNLSNSTVNLTDVYSHEW